MRSIVQRRRSSAAAGETRVPRPRSSSAAGRSSSAAGRGAYTAARASQDSVASVASEPADDEPEPVGGGGDGGDDTFPLSPIPDSRFPFARSCARCCPPFPLAPM